jgi:hypothetical protein
MLIVFGAAIVLVIPAIGLLYSLAQRDMIQETTAPEAREEALPPGTTFDAP